MIELIFNDSGAAALKAAKGADDRCSAIYISDSQGEVIAVASEPCTDYAIEGDIGDIAAIWLMADVGDISISDWDTRLKILRDITDANELETDAWIKQESKRAEELVRHLVNAAKAGEAVRIWWSDIPYETCGYYWGLSLLKDSKGAVSSVKIPRLCPKADGFSTVNGTGELAPEDFHLLLNLEKQVELNERKAIAQLWDTLVEENAPLRSVINGVLCSVPENFYDYVLYQVIPEGNFKVKDFIGRALFKGPGGISDWWYARRIREMIASGVLEIVHKSNMGFYYWTVRRTK